MAVGREIAPLIEGLAREDETLRVEANLQLEVDGTKFAVSSRGDRLRVHAPSVGACVSLMRSGGDRLFTIATLLDKTNVTAELCTGDAVLAVVGADAAPGPVESTLFEDPVEIRAGGVLAGLLRVS